MNRAALTLLALGCAIALTAAITLAGREQRVSINDVPQAVRQTIDLHLRGGKIREIERSTHRGKTIYEVEVRGADGTFEFVVAEDGAYLGPEHDDDDDEHADRDDDDDDANHDDDDHAEKISYNDVPGPVRLEFSRIARGTRPTVVHKSTHDGVTTYEIDFERNGAEASARFTETGQPIKVEREIAIAKLPEPVVQAILRHHPGATFDEAESVQFYAYEVEFKLDGKEHEVLVLADGRIAHALHEHDDDDDDHDEDDDHDDDEHEHEGHDHD